MDRTQTCFIIAHAQSLNAECDLETQATDLVLSRYSLPYYGYYLCQKKKKMKLNDAGQSYGPHMDMFH